MRGMRRKSDAAAHDQAVHHHDNRLGIARDQDVEPVFDRPESRREPIGGMGRLSLRTGLAGIVKRANVAAGAEAALAGAVEQHDADFRVCLPPPQ